MKKKDDLAREINRIKEGIRKRRRNGREHCKLSLRPNELKNMKTENENNVDALEHINSHIELAKDPVKLNNKNLKII